MDSFEFRSIYFCYALKRKENCKFSSFVFCVRPLALPLMDPFHRQEDRFHVGFHLNINCVASYPGCTMTNYKAMNDIWPRLGKSFA